MKARTKTRIITTIGVYFLVAGVGGIVTAGALVAGVVGILIGLAFVRWGATVSDAARSPESRSAGTATHR